MPSHDSKRDLLFALTALKQRGVDERRLFDACRDWAFHPDHDLAKWLQQNGCLTHSERNEVEKAIAEIATDEGAARQVDSQSENAPGRGIESTAGLSGDSLTEIPSRRGAATVVGEAAVSSPISFKKVRNHASGGLGNVSVAWDATLQREVALKEIRVDRRSTVQVRERFVNEARITGALEHPGIVPVYAMVEDKEGNPYYAMRFVEGRTLKEANNDFHDDRSPRSVADKTMRFRELLRHFIDACQAVAYAHSRGVIHRDLKPANIMLGEFGETLVVDWGLAKRFSESNSEESGGGESSVDGESQVSDASDSIELTRAGQVLGTIAYMSPEQARARRLSPATDIYSLGAMLFELVSGESPYARVPKDEVLEHVRLGRVPALRSISPTAPLALDAICRVALSARLADRYESATAMADDVERFLADEPVSVLREPAKTRLRRWTRRHRTLVTTCVVALAIAAGILSVSTWQLEGKNVELRASNGLLVEERNRSDKRAGLAMSAIDEFRTAVADNLAVKGRPEFAGLRDALLSAPRRFYKSLLADFESAKDTRLDSQRNVIDAQAKLASLEFLVGSQQSAESLMLSALEAAERLDRTETDDVRRFEQLAGIHSELGAMLTNQGDKQKHLELALSYFERLVSLQPKQAAHQLGMARALYNYGETLANQGHSAEALKHFQDSEAAYVEAMELGSDGLKNKTDLSQVRLAIGSLMVYSLGKPSDGLAYIAGVIPGAEQLAEEHPDDVEASRALARILGTQGRAYVMVEKREAALECMQREQELFSTLLERFPSYSRLRYEYAYGLARLAQFWQSAGKMKEAMLATTEQRKLLDRLVTDHPENLSYRRAWVVCNLGVGSNLYMTGAKAESVTHFEKLVPFCEETIAFDDSVESDLSILAGLHYNIGTICGELGDVEKGLAAHMKSLKIRERVAAANPDNPALQNQLAFTLGNIANIQATQLDDYEEAVEWWERARAIQGRIVKDHPDVGKFLNSLARTSNNLGSAYDQLNQPREARDAYADARESLEELVALNGAVTLYRRDLAKSRWNEGTLQAREGDEAAGERSMRQALDDLQALADEAPDEKQNVSMWREHQARFLPYLAARHRLDEGWKFAEDCVNALTAMHEATPTTTSRTTLRYALFARAQLFARQGDLAAAVEDYDRAVAVGETPVLEKKWRDGFLAAWSGDAETVRSIAQKADAGGESCFYVARLFGMLITHPKHPSAQDHFASDCVSWLQRAAEKGYFADDTHQYDLASLPEFRLVTAREDVQEIIRQE